MKLHDRYIKLKEQNPYWGDIPILHMAIQPGDSKQSIRTSFDRLVSKEDYRRAEREAILDGLYARAGWESKLAHQDTLIF